MTLSKALALLYHALYSQYPTTPYTYHIHHIHPNNTLITTFLFLYLPTALTHTHTYTHTYSHILTHTHIHTAVVKSLAQEEETRTELVQSQARVKELEGTCKGLEGTVIELQEKEASLISAGAGGGDKEGDGGAEAIKSKLQVSYVFEDA